MVVVFVKFSVTGNVHFVVPFATVPLRWISIWIHCARMNTQSETPNFDLPASMVLDGVTTIAAFFWKTILPFAEGAIWNFRDEVHSNILCALVA